ncbi:hypothetical protein VTN00DRAFT_3584 [Thermoascus crustaceus]|uniref:uncharacterized protein n=1 Tax=Thermoascus crustaceus TaxID=5088 RepID=UPI0037441778
MYASCSPKERNVAREATGSENESAMGGIATADIKRKKAKDEKRKEKKINKRERMRDPRWADLSKKKEENNNRRPAAKEQTQPAALEPKPDTRRVRGRSEVFRLVWGGVRPQAREETGG